MITQILGILGGGAIVALLAYFVFTMPASFG